MDIDELAQRINNIRHLEELESKPASSFDPIETMDIEESRRYVRFLLDQLQEERDEKKRVQDMFDDIREQLRTALDELSKSQSRIADMSSQISTLNETIRILLEQQAIAKKERYDKKSQKMSKSKEKDNTPEPPSRQEQKDDFDGSNLTRQQEAPAGSIDEKHTAGTDPARKGSKYQKMQADEVILHHSDETLIPAGCTFLFKDIRKSFEEVVKVIEHDYEIVVYMDADGVVHNAYLPSEEMDKENYHPYIDRFPGTHASADFLANLVFNKYQMETPFYREMLRIWTQNMSTCRQTLINWTRKPYQYLLKVVEQLKRIGLQDGSVVNVDETWQRLVLKKCKKVYLWCLVNAAEKIVLFFYDKGSRSRASLKEFLGDARLDALQSDGYNVYMYLDDCLISTTHLCCMAHARAKFVYALEQGKDDRARLMLKYIEELYDIERYVKGKSVQEIQKVRQQRATHIRDKMRQELDRLKGEIQRPLSDLIGKAVNYMDTFWNQLFLYINDGRYTIDNLAAERNIRPLTVERKNSMFFCSHHGAEVSALYHTIIATCKMQGYAALDYLKSFFREIILGRRDYENLMPSTIGISTRFNKH